MKKLVRHPLVLVLASAMTMAFVAGCDDDDDGMSPDNGGPVAQPSFQNDVLPLLVTPTCNNMNCHDSNMPAAGLDLSTLAAGDLVGRMSIQSAGDTLIIAGNAQDSYLIRKLEGRDMADMTVQMPAGGNAAYSSDDIGTIRNWIDQGAQDN